MGTGTLTLLLIWMCMCGCVGVAGVKRGGRGVVGACKFKKDFALAAAESNEITRSQIYFSSSF